ncbi:MAG: hypothetical protein RLZZ390_412, partial [Bacteroidota bacterium]
MAKSKFNVETETDAGVSGQYKNWFLDYASYVILERAVPDVADGLKPVHSIQDALVNLGQKDIMIDTQGNWGDVRTGDDAAAARYIEARLSKFGLEVAFNAKTTQWQLSYDGRKKEPVHLPVKFPLLLAQGAEGIAVGLS